jgi:hypothetical protein
MKEEKITKYSLYIMETTPQRSSDHDLINIILAMIDGLNLFSLLVRYLL